MRALSATRTVSYTHLIEPYIACYAEYSSPKGRNSYQDRKLYNLEELSVHILNEKKKSEQKETKSYQRRIMTDSLRYDITVSYTHIDVSKRQIKYFAENC